MWKIRNRFNEKQKLSVQKKSVNSYSFFFCFQLAIYLSGKTVFCFFLHKNNGILCNYAYGGDERTWFHFARVHLRTSKQWMVYIIKRCQSVKIWSTHTHNANNSHFMSFFLRLTLSFSNHFWWNPAFKTICNIQTSFTFSTTTKINCRFSSHWR